MCSLKEILENYRNRKRTHPEKKNRKINFTPNDNHVQVFENIHKIDFERHNKICYQRCLANKIDNLWTSVPDGYEIISCKKRSYMTCKIYKILKNKLPITIDNSQPYVIIKEYLSYGDDYWGYIKYKTLSEVFFQTLTYHETKVQTPQIYFWGYHHQTKKSYIVMFYIDKNVYSSIKDISSSPSVNLLTEQFFSQVSQEFKLHQFYHNDLMNNGNILTNKHSPFEGQKMSYVIDFGEADVSCQNPFDKRSPIILLKKEIVI